MSDIGRIFLQELKIHNLANTAHKIHADDCERMQAGIDKRFRALMAECRQRLGLVPLGRPKNSGFRHD